MAHIISQVTKVEKDGSIRYQLCDGPSKFSLMLAVFGSREQRPPIHFRSKARQVFDVEQLGVKAEDGSGESFLFEGQLPDGHRVEGYFETRNRSGWIRVAPTGADRSFFHTPKGGK